MVDRAIFQHTWSGAQVMTSFVMTSAHMVVQAHPWQYWIWRTISVRVTSDHHAIGIAHDGHVPRIVRQKCGRLRELLAVANNEPALADRRQHAVHPQP